MTSFIGATMGKLKDRKRNAKPRLSMDDAKTLIKSAAVVLRDNTPMSYMEASIAFLYCWQHTESISESEQRTREISK